ALHELGDQPLSVLLAWHLYAVYTHHVRHRGAGPLRIGSLELDLAGTVIASWSAGRDHRGRCVCLYPEDRNAEARPGEARVFVLLVEYEEEPPAAGRRGAGRRSGARRAEGRRRE